MKDSDKSYSFINSVEKHFNYSIDYIRMRNHRASGMKDVEYIMDKYHINDVNLVKPGIGESTRVLLRRVPDIVIINHQNKDDEELKPILRLAKEKSVKIVYDDLSAYKVCGVIRNMADA